MKHLLTLLLVINFLNTEGMFILGSESIYWFRINQSIGLLSSTGECVWNQSGTPEDCNPHVLRVMQSQMKLYVQNIKTLLPTM